MTTKTKAKSITLRAFRIESAKLTKKDSGLLKMLSEKLDESVAQNRRMLINKDDSEEDLISDYSIRNGINVFGAVLRIQPSDDVMNIPDKLFKSKKFTISDLDKNLTETSISYKDHYYFLLNSEYLVTNLRRNITIPRFQTYINWFLNEDRGNFLFEFTPMITDHPPLKLNELKQIRFQDPIHKGDAQEASEETKKIRGLSLSFVKDILKDTASLDELMLNEMVSAELFIKFVKPKQMKKEDYERKLGAYLKPISDTDNVSFIPKKGAPISSSTILRTKTVDIEITESSKISEKQLMQEMEKYIQELSDDDKN